MNIKKLPLAERLNRLAQDRPAYPEYAAAIIRRISSMPIMSYMEDSPKELRRIIKLLELTPIQASTMTYADVAARIGKWYTSYTADKPQRHAAALQAVGLLAAPLAQEYRLYAPPSRHDDDDSNNDNSDFEEV